MGSLKLLGKLDCNCFTSWQDFIKAIPSMFAVEIPPDITNVTLSNNQPDADQQDHVWFKLNSAGNFVGIFLYITGSWRQVYPVPNQIFQVFGDSRVPPTGYILVDSSNPNFTAAEVAALQANWVPHPTEPGVYTIFNVTYAGF